MLLSRFIGLHQKNHTISNYEKQSAFYGKTVCTTAAAASRFCDGSAHAPPASPKEQNKGKCVTGGRGRLGLRHSLQPHMNTGFLLCCKPRFGVGQGIYTTYPRKRLLTVHRGFSVHKEKITLDKTPLGKQSQTARPAGPGHGRKGAAAPSKKPNAPLQGSGARRTKYLMTRFHEGRKASSEFLALHDPPAERHGNPGEHEHCANPGSNQQSFVGLFK